MAEEKKTTPKKTTKKTTTKKAEPKVEKKIIDVISRCVKLAGP